MTACDALLQQAALGVAPALRAVDCVSATTVASTFGRLFGSQGALQPALTLLLTLYIATFAIALLTGRSRLSLAALSPRMLTIGLVLTFATSWIAYQSVVWNLVAGGPDEIARIVTGTRGSATQLFADRIDTILTAIDHVSQDAQDQAATAATPVAPASGMSPATVMWLAALLLLLGTVGVLLTARIAFAVLMALGPVFIVLALFRGSRGLAAGWLRGLVLTAVTPLFVVIGGGVTIELLVPIVQRLGGVDGPDMRAAIALFVVASVHVALMALMLRVAGTMVAGWQVFGAARPPEREVPQVHAMTPTATFPATPARAAVAITPVIMSTSQPASVSATSSHRRDLIAHARETAPLARSLPRRRAHGIGSRFPAARIIR